MPRLFVHNFRFDETEEGIIDAFRTFGQVTRVSIITDKDTGRSRGFGFVDIDPLPQFDDIVSETNGMTLHGRALNVELARDKKGHSNGGGGSKPAKRSNGGGRRSGRRERDSEDWD